LEVVATVLTIGTCAVVCGLAAMQVFGKAGQTAPAVSALPVGSIMKPVGEIAYESSALTVLVGLSSSCKYCTESMPAFQELNTVVRSRAVDRVRVLAVGLESQEVLTKYLQANELTEFRATSVKSGTEAGSVASRTPTLVIVDRTGKILVSWTGRMTPSEMNDVVERHLQALLQ